MSEFRRDPLSDHWVIIAPNRAERPEEYAPDASRRIPGRCPFCRGNEADTPGTVTIYAADGTPCQDDSWQVRVIPNKYPAVEDVQEVRRSSSGFYETRPGIGVHEVIIECPDHIIDFSQLGDDQVSLVFRAYRAQLRRLGTDARLAYAQIFKNSGAAAGASLEHAHSQLIATSVVPTQVQTELTRAREFHQRHGRCVFCVMLAEELAGGQRVVARTDRLVALCPFASQFPYEIWIVPLAHGSHFELASNEELGELGRLAKDMIGRVGRLLDSPGFNYLLHTSPFDTGFLDYYHWHWEIFPRVTKTAGFEWGAGDYINTVSPEDAARVLRAADQP